MLNLPETDIYGAFFRKRVFHMLVCAPAPNLQIYFWSRIFPKIHEAAADPTVKLPCLGQGPVRSAGSGRALHINRFSGGRK